MRRDLADFAPNVVHVSSPDVSGHRVVTLGRKRGLPILASVHTRFETYFRYYNMAFLEPGAVAILRRFYRRCDALVAPSESMAQLLREQVAFITSTTWEGETVGRFSFLHPGTTLEMVREVLAATA